MIKISENISIPLSEITLTAMRAQGPGGQHVNKVASAIQLKFDIKASSLPEELMEKLLISTDKRITKDGVIVIRAERFKSQLKNKNDALSRLQKLISKAAEPKKKRKPTKATTASKKKRIDEKKQRGQVKEMRKKVDDKEI